MNNFLMAVNKPGFVSERFMTAMDSIYNSALDRSLEKRKTIIIAGVISIIIGFILFSFVGRELLPSLDVGEFSIELELAGGATLTETSGICEIFENYLKASGSIENIFTKAGCDPDDNISEKISGKGVNYAIIKVFMKKDKKSYDIIDRMKKEIKLNERIKITYRLKDDIVASILSADNSKIEIEIYGNEPADLKVSGNFIKDALQREGGIKGITSLFDQETPELKVEIDRKLAASLGLNIEDVTSQLGMAVKGEVSSTYREGDDEIDIRVRLLKCDRTGVDSLRRIIIKSSTGITVPVSKFAEIKAGIGSGKIIRKEQSRINLITAEIIPGSEFVTDKIRNVIDRLNLRDGVLWKIADGREQIIDAYISLLFSMILAVVFIYMLLAGQFQSLKNPLIIMLSIPVAALGVSVSLLLGGQTININSGMGVIMLSGTVVNNAIVLFDYIEKEYLSGTDLRIAIIGAGRKRLKPILMTSMTTVFALVPIACGLGEGAELQRPLAVTVIGGMIVSTLLTLIFIPVVYYQINNSGINNK